jgi:hypothetical protein
MEDKNVRRRKLDPELEKELRGAMLQAKTIKEPPAPFPIGCMLDCSVYAFFIILIIYFTFYYSHGPAFVLQRALNK